MILCSCYTLDSVFYAVHKMHHLVISTVQCPDRHYCVLQTKKLNLGEDSHPSAHVLMDIKWWSQDSSAGALNSMLFPEKESQRPHFDSGIGGLTPGTCFPVGKAFTFIIKKDSYHRVELKILNFWVCK